MKPGFSIAIFGFRATIEKIDGICETVTVCQVKTYNREEDAF